MKKFILINKHKRTDEWLNSATAPVVVVSVSINGIGFVKLRDKFGNFYTTNDWSLYSVKVGDIIKWDCMFMMYNGKLVEVLKIKSGIALIRHESGDLDMIEFALLELCK